MKKIMLIILVCTIVFFTLGCAVQQNSAVKSETAKQSAIEPPVSPSEKQTQAQANAALIEPSVLISRAEAEKIIGKTLGEGKNKEQMAVGQKLCIYESDGDFLEVGLTQQAAMKGNMSPKSLFDGIISQFPDAKKVDGIGDEAYISTPGIHIMKSGYYITVSLGNIKDQANIEKLKEAGKTAVANLEAAVK